MHGAVAFLICFPWILSPIALSDFLLGLHRVLNYFPSIPFFTSTPIYMHLCLEQAVQQMECF